jgi:hypothetical protein
VQSLIDSYEYGTKTNKSVNCQFFFGDLLLFNNLQKEVLSVFFPNLFFFSFILLVKQIQEESATVVAVYSNITSKFSRDEVNDLFVFNLY